MDEPQEPKDYDNRFRYIPESDRAAPEDAAMWEQYRDGSWHEIAPLRPDQVPGPDDAQDRDGDV